MLSLGKELGAIAVWFVIIILYFVASLMQIYTAIAVGHQWSAHRVLGSVLAFFGIGIIRNTIAGLLGKIGYRIGLADFIAARFESNLLLTWQFQVSVIVSTLILIAIYAVVTWYFLDRKLNLE